MNDDIVKKFLEGLGIMSDMSLAYYRALITSGATKEEARNLTFVFLEAMITAGQGQKEDDSKNVT